MAKAFSIHHVQYSNPEYLEQHEALCCQ